MGCGGSRLDGNGTALPPRLRPLFLLRLEEFKMRRHNRPIKDSGSTTSKLLLHEKEEYENSSPSDKNATKNYMPLSPKDDMIFGGKYEEKQPGKPEEEIIYGKKEKKYDRKHEAVKDGNIKEESEYEDALTDAYHDNDDDEDDDDDDDDEEDGRMIGHDGFIGAFPGSPTFRVYFKDDEEDKHNDLGKNKNSAFRSTISSDGDTLLSKESCECKNKKVKRGRKKKTFRKVLPKGGQAAVKNLLSVKSCYTPSPSAHHHHHHSHFLTGKTTA